MMKKYLISIVYVIIGAALAVFSFVGKLDEFWSGMGAALLAVGALRLIRAYRLNKNETYRERMEVEVNDERNHYIRNKAWAWAGYMFVILSAIAVIVFKVTGHDDWSMAAAMAEGLMLILFWVSYHILKRKY